MAVESEPEPDESTGGRDIQADVSRIVRAMLGFADLNQSDLAPVLGIQASGVSEKMRGIRKWTLADLAAMAEFFTCVTGDNIEPGLFLAEPRGIIVQNLPWSPSFIEANGQTAFAFTYEPAPTVADTPAESGSTYLAVA